MDNRLVIAICTRGRPQMLAACLGSVAQTDVPSDTKLKILIVDNSEDPEAQLANQKTVADLAGRVPAAIVTEPRLGIPFARNRALDFALDHGAGALIFLDDDQTIPANYVSVLLQVQKEEGADAVYSARTWIFEGDAHYRAFFEEDVKPDAPMRERSLKQAPTCGVLIQRRLFDELGLRFDTSYPLCGGTDTLFFFTAYCAGAMVVSTREVRSTEFCSADQQTLAWLVRRYFRVGVSRTLLRSNGKSRLRNGSMGVIRTITCVCKAPLTWHSRVTAIRNLLRLVKWLGSIYGAFGLGYREYKTVRR